MKTVVTVVVAGIATASCSGSGNDGGAEAAEARDYVALGDSYAAGLGAGNYADTECYRSTDSSYPRLWAKSRPAGTIGEVTDSTCSGAVIHEVRTTQLRALDEKTGWVTVTVGGNDVGWSQTLQQCMLGNDLTCGSATRTAASTAETVLPEQLDGLYTAIKERAPNAKVYVLGYPHLLASGTGVKCESLSAARREALNTGADTLNELIKARAANAGFTFVDVREIFDGHEVCTATPWIHAVRDQIAESFHPTADGQKAYATALTAVTG
ncbi:SGNH/GDSL hydrolase family protein [Actinoplanes aureus]|uniref:SGNH/GDSL hydrolase family protein n=1 Tax=Actinoplanes aureus TaxID=2792083 RepID=A0A931CGM1_9ACTN|nr:SGNH/GDSL hydrolase family protein [Actinoplanes aureus]MBG0567202.1 SGNH/GDSL hydrolase family protein [Actinoplanes aureus]